MKNKTRFFGILFVGALLGRTADASVAGAVRAGSFGYGVDFDIGLSDDFNVRLGYNALSYNRTVDDTDVRYRGKLKISSPSAIVDWHAFHGGFRIAAGLVDKGPKVDIVGTPAANNTYELNGHVYTASQVGSITGNIKVGDSVAPYLGIGWGNAVDREGRVSFLFDLGVIHTGKPKTTLTVACNAGIPTATCAQLQNDANAEKADLEDSYDKYDWYPVISLGLAVRF